MGDRIEITTPDGSFAAYRAEPAGTPKGGLVLIQEIFGINHVMRDLADSYAALGYRVLCPDLFWRQEPGIDITDKSEAEWKKAFELFGGFDVNLGVEDLKATLAALRASLGGKKVGTVGYCLGGKLAYLMATRSDVDAAVSYYGVGLSELMPESVIISKPILMHVAELDKFVPAPARAIILEEMGKVPTAEMHLYAGVDHAFARVGGEHFDAAAADAANTRTRDFLNRTIG